MSVLSSYLYILISTGVLDVYEENNLCNRSVVVFRPTAFGVGTKISKFLINSSGCCVLAKIAEGKSLGEYV